MSARLIMRVLPLAERFNRMFSAVDNTPVFDNADFPWVPALEREWRTIRAELDHVIARKNELPGFQDILPDVALISRDRGWKSFMLAGMGARSKRNTALCPQTWRIVQAIPGLSMAMFSIFEPGKRLWPHRGPYNGVLRLHLGLIVPNASEAVAIRVGPHVRHWEEGKVLIFDDSYEHEAWNNSDHLRVVLFVDFARPLKFPANAVNTLLLKLAALSAFVREGRKNQRQWEREFYGIERAAG
ncbi:MAG: aspartyl/asparaginyl beta-hydroxylase domain-containing protein [Candidatus Eremiobacteraeota bacterium]|nr:aspartyl/asparaginyl beta-hydroxylase domain-containing protein [Candidatus Eremiobacteraeota bacterium]